MTTKRWRYALFGAVAGALVIATVIHKRVPQDPAYHQFADQRVVLGIPNWWNVVSNVPFLLAGIAGLAILRKNPRGALRGLYPEYALFFISAILIAFGSAFYHLRPDNERLTFDRLPMTIGFAAFVAIVLGEHLGTRAGRRALPFLIIAGVASVIYWQATESAGRGDLRPYVLVQLLPMLLVPVVLLLFPSPLSSKSYLWGVLATYFVAKIFEVFDEPCYRVLGVSGHSLKHVSAAAGIALMAIALRNRRPPEEPQIFRTSASL